MFCLLTGWAVAVSGLAQEAREADLAAIRDEIQRLQADLETVGQKAHDLAGKLAQTDLEIRLQESRVAEATAAHGLAVHRVELTRARVGELEQRLAELRQDLREQLVVLYRLGRQGYLRLFLSIGPETDLMAAIRQLRFLVRRDSAALERYRLAKADLDAERDRLLREQDEVEEWLDSERRRRRGLAAVHQRQQRLLARMDRERQTLEIRTDELVDKERRLARLIDLLFGDAPSALEGTPVQDLQGVLDWPVAGTVAVGFGPRLDPRYKTQVPHNGIEIAVDRPAEVRVVFPGEVLFAAPFKGYGPTAIVHHPGRVFTLYAGLSQLHVEQGDVVSLGDAIGLIDERLYFEVRSKNQPEDPLLWLR